MSEPDFVPGSSVSPKFAGFNLRHFDYKRVNEVPIPATVFIPEGIKPGKIPLIVRWHGGGLGTGHRLFPDWTPQYVLDFCQERSAIMVMPDYRLMPEAKGIDILNDARDFYAWILVPDNLRPYIPLGFDLDLDHILVIGESAGGYLAIQSGFITEAKQHIAAIIAQYPMIDLEGPWFAEDDPEKKIMTPPVPRLEEKVITDVIDSLQGDEVVTGRTPPDRLPFLLAMIQHGVFPQYFGDEPELYPLRVLDSLTAAEKDYPPLWIYHGEVDSMVKIDGTRKFVTALKEKLPQTKLLAQYLPGEDHGFDNHDVKGLVASLETEWVRKGVQFVGDFWPIR